MARKCIIVHPKHPMVQPKPATFCQLPMEILHGIASHMEPQVGSARSPGADRCTLRTTPWPRLPASLSLFAVMPPRAGAADV